MAQIDTSGIENFDSMTAEEKVTALLSFQYDDGTEKIKAAEDNAAKMKAAFDKAASEVAGYKKQLKEKMTAEEIQQQENESQRKALEERLAELELREKISTAKAEFLSVGLDDTMALAAANAMNECDVKKLCAELVKWKASIEVSTKSKLMDMNPKPESGGKVEADDGKDTSIAVQLGKARAETAKKAQSIIDSYTRR